jgi:hypothetical protein
MKSILYFLTCASFGLALTQPAFPTDDTGSTPPAPPSEEARAAFEACAQELGLPLPPKPDPARERSAEGERPPRPSREMHEKLRVCVEAKGFELPRKHGPGCEHARAGGQDLAPVGDDADSGT